MAAVAPEQAGQRRGRLAVSSITATGRAGDSSGGPR
jgi:hypothetical protein